MSEHAPDPSVAHFGPDGMRRIPLPSTYGVGLSEVARQTLRDVGVPMHVEPYFSAAGETDGLTLGAFTGHRGLVMQGERADWIRVGTDRLTHICVRPGGEVQAVFLARPEPDLFVSSDVTAFTASLAALDRHLPVIAASTSLPDAAAAFRELNAELRQIDPGAFESRENWWPRVLEDVRHTLNFPFSSAFEYVDDAGEKQIITAETGPGRPHPEEILWQQLAAAGVAPEQVRRVYCELEPCMMPGHYCAVWMQAAFPQAEFTHSFDYGDTADSREEGLKELITYAAQQAGQQ
ncbi:nucleic acid/nucleotide deaminase domain-containing protein [Streptomyces sp. NBC_00063]|uniref:nucleic acid/nucleotide deaminase domain-containing protein n=1 Tax=Streptomyces sp. NBC_00063 TaxID=2975638 RepID=UPI00225252DE|nr:nucleic acid/nucleotide deaminase domain-containing protein [Streptomyces sp. NBC_00063]MCX5440905.1 SUKH-4 family immunity protein [Streptomyces sp. NBC_00063]